MNKILLCAVALIMCATFTSAEGFPQDFPEIMDQGGFGQGEVLTGFGGNLNLDKEGNRKALTKNPVILLHGNGGSATSYQWGMTTLKSFLKKAGYNDSEIWAVSYLGYGNGSADMYGVHKNNINDVRNFIDGVREYLGVQKVDIMAHSLGGGLAKSYMLGLERDGSFNVNKRRFDAVGTLITMAAGHYGLGYFSVDEFATGSPLETAWHVVDGVNDDTPFGATGGQKGKFQKTTQLDNNQITYVAVWASGDFIDAQNTGTGRLVGAHLNRGYSLGSSITGHERIIKDQGVFNDVRPFLNTHPNINPNQPKPPVVSFSPNGGAFKGKANVTISATNKPDSIMYSVGGGAWTKYTAPIAIENDVVIRAKAENKYGVSKEIEAKYTKSTVPNFEKALATCTAHYLAGRVNNQEYLALGMRYGYINPFHLYRVEGQDRWTDVEPK